MVGLGFFFIEIHFSAVASVGKFCGKGSGKSYEISSNFHRDFTFAEIIKFLPVGWLLACGRLHRGRDFDSAIAGRDLRFAVAGR